MVDARLHPADVVTHDEYNVGFLPAARLRVRGRTYCDQASDYCQGADKHPTYQPKKIR
jgi:hypothetical protein